MWNREEQTGAVHTIEDRGAFSDDSTISDLVEGNATTSCGIVARFHIAMPYTKKEAGPYLGTNSGYVDFNRAARIKCKYCFMTEVPPTFISKMVVV